MLDIDSSVTMIVIKGMLARKREDGMTGVSRGRIQVDRTIVDEIRLTWIV
tara:strand:- start:296 stop:445 length:150 start_codon:yes stop_codon:yes gene_type:complete